MAQGVTTQRSPADRSASLCLCLEQGRDHRRRSFNTQMLTRSPAPADWGIYLVTDRDATNGRDLVEVGSAALRGGVGAVQRGERGRSTREILALAHALRAVTRRHGAALLVNDRI